MEDLSKLDRITIQLFALMQQVGLKCSYYKNQNELFSNIFDINDMTCTGDTFGVSINLNLNTVDKIEDTPEEIEKFCANLTREIGTSILNEKIARLLQHQPTNKIIMPNS